MEADLVGLTTVSFHLVGADVVDMVGLVSFVE